MDFVSIFKYILAVELLLLLKFTASFPLTKGNSAVAKLPGDSLTEFLDLLTPKEDYNLHYDQRQTGSENYRLHLDGFFIAAPHDINTDNLIEQLGASNLIFTDMYKNSKNVDSIQAVSNKPDVVVVGVPSLTIKAESGEVDPRNSLKMESKTNR